MSKHTDRRLTDAELNAVTGGEGSLANACYHAATQWLQAHTYPASGFGWDLRKELECN